MTDATTVTINGWRIRGLIPSKLQEIKLSELIKAGCLNPYDIRVKLDIRSAIVVDAKSKTLTFWKIYGIDPSFTESIYPILDKELAIRKGKISRISFKISLGTVHQSLLNPKNFLLLSIGSSYGKKEASPFRECLSFFYLKLCFF